MPSSQFPIRLGLEGDEQVKAKLAAVITAATGLDKQLDATGQGSARRAADAFAAFGAETDRLRARFVPLAAAQQQYRLQLAELNAANARGVLSQTEYAAALVRTKNGFAEQVRSLQRATPAIAGAAGTYRNIGSVAQQAGFQIGDFAVQVASGGGVIRPFIQQGTQLLQFFGPWGSIIGAAGAVVGALAIAFLDLDRAAEDLDYSLSKVDRAQIDALSSAELYKEAIERSNDVLLTAQERADQLALSNLEVAKAYVEASVQAESLRQTELAAERDRLAKLQRLSEDPTQSAFVSGLNQAGDIDALNRQIAESETRVAELEARLGRLLSGDTGAAREAAHKAEVDRQKEIMRLIADRAAAEDRDAEAAKTRAQKIIDGMTARRKALADELALAERRLELAGLDARSREIELRLLQEINKERAAGTPLLKGEIEERRKVIAAIVDAEQALAAQETAIQELERIADQAFDRIGSAITQAFATGKLEALDLLNVGKAVLSELAQAAIKLGAINPLKNLLGLSGGTPLPTLGSVIAASGGGSGGGGGGGAAGGLFSIGRQLAGLGTGGSLSSFLFGTAPLTGAGGFLTGGGVTSTLAAGGTGGLLGSGGAFLGSTFLADAFLPGIGALLPGLIGGNFAQAGLGLGGALLGTAFGGPIGGALGGLFGNLLGGLFGSKKKTPQAVTNITAGPGGAGVGGNVVRAGGNVGATTSLAGDIAAAVNGVVEALGGQLTSEALGGYILTSTGKNQGTVYLGGVGQYGKGTELGKIFGSGFTQSTYKDAAKTAEAVAVAIILENAKRGAIEGLSASESTVLSKTKARDLEALNADLTFAQLYDQLTGVVEETTEYQKAVEALSKSYADAREQAARLGLDVGKLTEKQAEAIARLTTDFNAGIQDQILGLTNPQALALRELERAQAKRLEEAKAAGADLVEVERLSALERQRVIEQFAGGLKSLQEELLFGAGGGASPASTLAGLRASFEAAAAQGDASGIQRYGAALAAASRDFYASGAGFQSDRDRILAVIGQQLAAPADASFDAANQTAASTAEMSAAMQELLSINREQLRINQAQAAEIAQLRQATQAQAAQTSSVQALLARQVNAPQVAERGGRR